MTPQSHWSLTHCKKYMKCQEIWLGVPDCFLAGGTCMWSGQADNLFAWMRIWSLYTSPWALIAVTKQQTRTTLATQLITQSGWKIASCETTITAILATTQVCKIKTEGNRGQGGEPGNEANLYKTMCVYLTLYHYCDKITEAFPFNQKLKVAR